MTLVTIRSQIGTLTRGFPLLAVILEKYSVAIVINCSVVVGAGEILAEVWLVNVKTKRRILKEPELLTS
jgi:hypothetical protein